MGIKMTTRSTGGRPFSKTYDYLNIDESIVPELRTIVKNNGVQLVQGAQKRSPVDTGALRRSIRLSLENNKKAPGFFRFRQYTVIQTYGILYLCIHRHSIDCQLRKGNHKETSLLLKSFSYLV